jgi:predicted 3-demethylubiquinone-9 3-methyltransferase (glyoxalase superfamily)
VREGFADNENAPVGSVKLARIEFNGAILPIMDSPFPHDLDLTPSMSVFVELDGEDEPTQDFSALRDGGEIMVPLDDYGLGGLFGWCRDRFGLSWQRLRV